MSEPQGSRASADSGKQYWHPRPRPSGLGPAGLDSVPVNRPQSVARELPAGLSIRRTARTLRHPVTTFMLFVVAVIFLGAALLAVTGNGGLAMPPVKAVNCAPPGSRVLGPQGAQFTAALPQRTVLLASADVCSYMFRAGNGTAFTVEAMLGSGPITFGSVADWTDHGAVRRVTRSGTSGVEAIHCDSLLHGCRGALQLSRGDAKWQALGSGDAASLPAIAAFLRSFDSIR